MKVKIISGGYGLRREGGRTRLVLKGSIVDLEEEEARYLIENGSAEEVSCEDAGEAPKAERFSGLTAAELRNIARERGVLIPPRATKAQIIEALGK